MLNQTPEQRELARQRRAEQLRHWHDEQKEWEFDGTVDPPVEHPKEKNKGRRPQFPATVALLDASSAGDVLGIREALRNGADPNAQDLFGISAMHRCAMVNSGMGIKVLLDAGADIEIADIDRWTPLFTAIEYGSTIAVECLIEHGANLLATDHSNTLPVDLCQYADMQAYLKETLDENGCTLAVLQEARDYEGEFLLKEVQRCVKEKRPLTSIAIMGSTPEQHATVLHIAAAKGYTNVAKACLSAGMDVDVLDWQGWSPVHASVYWDNWEITKMLVAKGADLNRRNEDDHTPIDLAPDDETAKVLQDMAKKQKPKAKLARSGSEDSGGGSLKRFSSTESSGHLGSSSGGGGSSSPKMPRAGSTGSLERTKSGSNSPSLGRSPLSQVQSAGEADGSTDRSGSLKKESSHSGSMKRQGSSSGRIVPQHRYGCFPGWFTRNHLLLVFGLLFGIAAPLIAGGVLVRLTTTCLPGQEGCDQMTSSPTAVCADKGDCGSCMAQRGCVWCQEWDDTLASFVSANICAQGGLNGAQYCLSDGTCGTCKVYFYSQCLVPYTTIYPILLACVIVSGVCLFLLVVLIIRHCSHYVCRRKHGHRRVKAHPTNGLFEAIASTTATSSPAAVAPSSGDPKQPLPQSAPAAKHSSPSDLEAQPVQSSSSHSDTAKKGKGRDYELSVIVTSPEASPDAATAEASGSNGLLAPSGGAPQRRTSNATPRSPKQHEHHVHLDELKRKERHAESEALHAHDSDD